MMDTTVERTMHMSLNTWRGYSAYEVAVQNGFEGSETEWLASLKGEPGDDAATITVNRKDAVDKNIMLYGTDIYVQSGSTRTIAQAMENMVTSDVVVDALDSGDTTKPLSAAAGARLAAMIAGMVGMKMIQVTLPAANWDDKNTQTVDADGITVDGAVITAAAPETYKAYTDAEVRNTAQGDGILTFEATYTPSVDVKANVLLLYQNAEEDADV